MGDDHLRKWLREQAGEGPEAATGDEGEAGEPEPEPTPEEASPEEGDEDLFP